jgi:hypothetical protein
MRLVRQALERFGLGGTVALVLSWHEWGSQVWLDPSEMQHDEEPEEEQQCEVGEKMGVRPWQCPLQNGLKWDMLSGI